MPENRAVNSHHALSSPDDLVVTRLRGKDFVSDLFRFEVDFQSPNPNIDPNEILGTPLGVEMELAEGSRWWHGHVAGFRLSGMLTGSEAEPLCTYTATLRPWLWFLKHRTDCRIFQNMTAVEIIEDVFSRHGTANFEKRLNASYPTREYCVQYDESDFDFVSRLMEHEGIFYFFEYDDGEHKLILTDAMSKLENMPGEATVPYRPASSPDQIGQHTISTWASRALIQPAAYAHTDYDFTKPSTPLMSRSNEQLFDNNADGENYRNPGAHLDVGRGDDLALIRREEIQAHQGRTLGEGIIFNLASGVIFTPDEHHRDADNAEHLALEVEYDLHNPDYMTGSAAYALPFFVRFLAAPKAVPYRPLRKTPRPIMRGPQTAVVVGPSGEEIYTDEYARVKVQFHWDRLGGKDENSSCFVRVSSVWAGANWGFIQIPRIGQEVIVDFIEGDPDHPIITGRVYNAEQMPPYSLPDNATQSGWKSNSSLGGGGFNELRFEDKKGEEEVYFQAEKDNTILVKHDRNELVQNDENVRIDMFATHSVGKDLDELVEENKTTHVIKNRTVNIDDNEVLIVGDNRTQEVTLNEDITIGKNQTIKVKGHQKIDVDLTQQHTVVGFRMHKVHLWEHNNVVGFQTNAVGAYRKTSVKMHQEHSIGGYDKWTIKKHRETAITDGDTVTVGKDQSITIKGNQSISTTDGGRLITVKKGQTHDVTEDVWIKSGKKMKLEAADEILLECGDASIKLEKNGKITIKGGEIMIDGSKDINIKSSKNVNIKGSKVNQN